MFQIKALDPASFAPLMALDDTALIAHGGRRVVATSDPGFPCRVSLADAAVGERLILVNHQHLGGNTPFAARHAVYIRENARQAEPAPGEIPNVLARRLLSVRAFDNDSMMVEADVVEGAVLGPLLERLFASDAVAFVHLHYAKPGCFAAAVERV